MPKENLLINVLLDWKTKPKIYDEVEQQMSAYEQADFEETGEHCEYLIVVNVTRSRPHEVTFKVFKRSKKALNKFLRLRANFDDEARLAKIMEVQ